jgi:uncharacterized protein
MFRFCFAIVVLLLSCASVKAQLLWEISGNDLPYKSYLFGTHHLVSVDILDSVPGVYRAFNASRAVVGEVAVDDPALVRKMTDAARMPNYITMHELFSDSDYVLVDTTLQRVLGMGLTELALLKPAMIQNLFLLELYRQAMPQQDGDWSLDSFFQQVAAQKNIPVVGLESVDDQIALLYNAQTLHRQAFLLVGAVREANSVIDEVAQLNALYRRGDLDGLLQLYEADTTQYAPTQQERFALLDERNDAWARRLPKLMEEQPCFIAVGAMHLAGENGLIALLKKAGYKVRAVKR